MQQRELTDAQEYLTGSFPLTIETPGAIALQVLNAVFYGLDLNDLQTYRERVNMITVDDIQRVAQQYLHPDRLTIVLVGDASVFAKQLAGVGFDQVERIPLADLDLSSPDLRRGQDAGRRPDSADRLPARRAGTGAGSGGCAQRRASGRARADRAGDRRKRGPRPAALDPDGQDGIGPRRWSRAGARTNLPSTTTIRYPGAYRMEAQTPAGRVVQVFNSGKYWIRTSAARVTRRRSWPSRFAAPSSATPSRCCSRSPTGESRPNGSPTSSMEGRAMPAIEIALPGSTPLTLMFDPATALIVKTRYVFAGAPDGRLAVEEEYSDYRDVRGLKVAFKMQLRREGAPAVDRTVRSFDFNVPLDVALFTKPS